MIEIWVVESLDPIAGSYLKTSTQRLICFKEKTDAQKYRDNNQPYVSPIRKLIVYETYEDNLKDSKLKALSKLTETEIKVLGLEDLKKDLNK